MDRAPDFRFMRRAIELAARGIFGTDPNPRVGAVLVRDGEIVGEGWHWKAGTPHAEVHALQMAGERARGADCYVTLEPCSHYGRTPPCADALAAAGVRRVVVAMGDPNPLVAGRGVERLRAAGILVEEGLLAEEAAALNPGFLSRMTRGRPWLRVKLAMSLDGRTALANGRSQWITGDAAREDVQRLRARSSVILTGSGTVLADDPRLAPRLGEEPARWPWKAVLDRALRIDPSARLLVTPGGVVIFHAADGAHGADGRRREALMAAGARLAPLPEGPMGLDLHAALNWLARELEANEVLVEAGPRLSGALVAAGLVDEMVIYMAPMLLGSHARPLVELGPFEDLKQPSRWRIATQEMLGGDVKLVLRPAGA